MEATVFIMWKCTTLGNRAKLPPQFNSTIIDCHMQICSLWTLPVYLLHESVEVESLIDCSIDLCLIGNNRNPTKFVCTQAGLEVDQVACNFSIIAETHFYRACITFLNLRCNSRQ